jgi:hypothetical protein
MSDKDAFDDRVEKAAAGLRSATAPYANATKKLTRWVSRLLQRGVDGAELGAQTATDAVDRTDDSQRDTGCDQAIFNGGGAGFVIQKTRKKFGHMKPLLRRRLDPNSQQLQLS